MRKILLSLFLLKSTLTMACGGGYWDEYPSYNLLWQTNISAEEFYPFLRDDYNLFFEHYGGDYSLYSGNVDCWKEVLEDWDEHEIHKAIYQPNLIDWSLKQSKIEQSAKTYIDLATECSEMFSYRSNYNSWDYDQILNQKEVNPEALLVKANTLLNLETNPQLKTRYYYQIIRALHYSKNWEEAVRLFEQKIENQFKKDEIYYYLLDQIAGCYYSLEQYDKAAYLFTKVVNHSFDRKESAFISFSFCRQQGVDGSSLFNGKEDEKDLLLIKSLTQFSDRLFNVKEFIDLDANDSRIELLFMRIINQVEEHALLSKNGSNVETFPIKSESSSIDSLLSICNLQLENKNIENRDFWQLSSSYLSFIKQDIALAKSKLEQVKSFDKQKKDLEIVYEVFGWNEITPNNEAYLLDILTSIGEEKVEWEMIVGSNFKAVALDRVAHIYYKENELAKAFLIHNYISNTTNLNSLELLDELERFCNKPNKNEYEERLIKRSSEGVNIIDFIYYQKGIYHLYHNEPEDALKYFNKNKSYGSSETIPDTIFSNNIMECFNCYSSEVMEDEVYKAQLFSFIKPKFSRTELATYLIKLDSLRDSEQQWKAKLANYLLGNYYFNISNTGYYRGLLTDQSSIGDYNYFDYYGPEDDSEYIIFKRLGYNLSNIVEHNTRYFGLSNFSNRYYQNVLELSNDKELNARCLYLMAKNDLNDFYNGNSHSTYHMQIGQYHKITLPYQKSFNQLKESYSDTKFHEMIIADCSYYRYYADNIIK